MPRGATLNARFSANSAGGCAVFLIGRQQTHFYTTPGGFQKIEVFKKSKNETATGRWFDICQWQPGTFGGCMVKVQRQAGGRKAALG